MSSAQQHNGNKRRVILTTTVFAGKNCVVSLGILLKKIKGRSVSDPLNVLNVL